MTKRWELSGQSWTRNSLQNFQRRHQQDVTFKRCLEDTQKLDMVAGEAVAELIEDIKAEEDNVMGGGALIIVAQIASSSDGLPRSF